MVRDALPDVEPAKIMQALHRCQYNVDDAIMFLLDSSKNQFIILVFYFMFYSFCLLNLLSALSFI